MRELSRKELFHEIAAWGAGLFGDRPEQTAGGPDRTAQALDPALAGLAADFPDALLREEARHLGLDPARHGREEMLTAVLAALRPPSPPPPLEG